LPVSAAVQPGIHQTMTSMNRAAMPNPTPGTGFDPWNFRPDVAVEVTGAKLAGHKVEAIDGRVGTVMTAGLDPDDSYLVVSTGRLFGKKVQLPAGTVNHVDRTDRRIYVDRTRSQIKQAPDGDRQTIAGYYHQTYQS
jgi:hypothetical protein